MCYISPMRKNYVHARIDAEEAALLKELKKATGETESALLKKGLRLVYQQQVKKAKSALDLVKHSVGKFRSGIGDLSYNKKHLEGFGK